jgi:hypothetical protein
LGGIKKRRETSGPIFGASGGGMNAKKAKALRRLIKDNYTDPALRVLIYKEAKKQMKGK